MTTITCHAQIEHLTFMGIPIDGKLKDFHKELKKKGFRRISTSSYNTWSYEGIFSWDKVKIVVYFDAETKTVCTVGVIIPCGTMDNAEQTYQNYKKRLQEKYETDHFSVYFDFYKDKNDLFIKHIESGELKQLNRMTVKPQSDGTELSKISITKFDKTQVIGEKAGFSFTYLINEGNIGSIGITKTYNDKIDSDYRYNVIIIYEDGQNSKLSRISMNDDL